MASLAMSDAANRPSESGPSGPASGRCYGGHRMRATAAISYRLSDPGPCARANGRCTAGTCAGTRGVPGGRPPGLAS
jgi:hypothetical protein